MAESRSPTPWLLLGITLFLVFTSMNPKQGTSSTTSAIISDLINEQVCHDGIPIKRIPRGHILCQNGDWGESMCGFALTVGYNDTYQESLMGCLRTDLKKYIRQVPPSECTNIKRGPPTRVLIAILVGGLVFAGGLVMCMMIMVTL